MQKAPIFPAQLGGLAMESSGAWQGHRKAVRTSLNNPSNLHFAALFTGTASPRLTARGTSAGEWLLSAQLAEHHSSKRTPPTSFTIKQQN